MAVISVLKTNEGSDNFNSTLQCIDLPRFSKIYLRQFVHPYNLKLLQSTNLNLARVIGVFLWQNMCCID